MYSTGRHLLALAAISLLIFSAGCSDRDPAGLETARATIDPLVFDDDYGHDVYFQPFFETHYTAVSLDAVYAYGGFAPDGARSLKFNIAPIGSALGPWTGGVITSSGSRDLADFNALTFYARTNIEDLLDPQPLALDVVGFGNDNTGTSLYEAGRGNLSLTNDWAFFVVPIPSPSKLIAERGLFTFAEAPDPRYPDGYDVWVDEIKFAKLDNITNPRADMGYSRQKYFVGANVTVGSSSVTKFDVDGVDVDVSHSPNYFDFISDDPTVAKVDGREIQVVGAGTATVTAELNGVAANGYARLTVYDPPAEAAAPPTLPAGDVISMFNKVYPNVPVDTWWTEWSLSAPVQEYEVGGDITKMYTFSDGEYYAAIEFVNPKIDASGMTHLHLDVYAPEGTEFWVKLGSFPDGTVPGDPHPETLELKLNSTSTPPFTSGGWASLDIPLADFQVNPGTPGEWSWADIGHLFIGTALVGTTKTPLVLVDNVYWHK